jgi:hypothetical protein
MKINNGSICSDCEYFEHECDVPIGEDDYCCMEYCRCGDEEVVDEFYDNDKVAECKKFKEA